VTLDVVEGESNIQYVLNRTDADLLSNVIAQPWNMNPIQITITEVL
jgi:hypothetical protein